MTSSNKLPLSDVIDPGWAQALASVEDTIHELGDMLREENKLGNGYLPAGTDVLRAFTYPFDDVKVLIIGQDPYPTPGHAMGLSFFGSPRSSPAPLTCEYLPRASPGSGGSYSANRRPHSVGEGGRVPAESRPHCPSGQSGFTPWPRVGKSHRDRHFRPRKSKPTTCRHSLGA